MNFLKNKYTYILKKILLIYPQSALRNYYVSLRLHLFYVMQVPLIIAIGCVQFYYILRINDLFYKTEFYRNYYFSHDFYFYGFIIPTV